VRFRDIHVAKADRFSVGEDMQAGGYFLSIPVANRMADYEEYYRIPKALVDGFPGTLDTLRAIAEKSRRRENDESLIVQPGTDRGVAS
jgi:hypothetical protein